MKAKMDGLAVPRGAFGYIPEIGNRVYDAYEEFVTGCAVSLCSAAATMDYIAQAVRDTADEYRSSDESSQAALAQIDLGLGATDIWGVK